MSCSSPTIAITLDRVSKVYPGGHVAVRDVTLNIQTGEVLVLVGTSGSGKTTTMKMINRLVEPTSGSIRVGGEDISKINPIQLRRSIGYVIQEIGLFPHMTVAKNIALVPSLKGWPKPRQNERVAELLELVGLPPDQYAKKHPHQLSGGQKQRVGVARALAGDPDILLMDEPFGALDPITRGQLHEEFLKLQRRLRKTIVFVTHDMLEAIRLAERIAVMDGGVLEQVGTPREVLAHPATRRVADLVGADATLKLLGLCTVEQALEALGAESPDALGPVIRSGDSLKDALLTMVACGRASLPVVNVDGTLRGRVTLQGLQTALAGQEKDRRPQGAARGQGTHA
ncbi:MAG: ABC transporter ATP-binding protein [Candidatus Rokubacteria bacterium]|nr:ABC transporter ATP-binding protein [Candidatus Rokubacteria bacterium]